MIKEFHMRVTSTAMERNFHPSRLGIQPLGQSNPRPSLRDELRSRSVSPEQLLRNRLGSRRRLCIAMVSDFFYPGLGGVEMHIYQLSQCLIERGYKVIVITHFRDGRHGVRYMTNGLKVYYLPFTPFYDNCTLPTLYAMYPLMRDIFIREGVDLVHGHQATANSTHETLFHAKTMGLKTVYTDHSLFGFGEAAGIHINKILKCYLSDVAHAIAVSHVNKENLVLRAAISPDNVSVIPNAVDSSRFTPDPSKRPAPPRINIVVISRLTYRKGIDLLTDVIPAICQRFSHVHWIVGGDGPKRLDLEQMIEKWKLHDRVDLLGRVEHDKVRDVMVEGHIFVNCSLTEAFCIAIVEAACCGLAVVSTDVGGVPEVLPPSCIRLAAPRADLLTEALALAIENDVPKNNPFETHEQVREIYNWFDVAERTEKVYEKVLMGEPVSFRERLSLVITCGPIMGIVLAMIVSAGYVWANFWDWFRPAETIEKFPDFPFDRFKSLRNKEWAMD